MFVLTIANNVSAATAIYRSVGPTATGSLDALEIGTGNNLNISGSTATFDSALGNNIGVGDAIQYDSDGNDSIDTICFIHGRTDSTHYTVKTVSGEIPTAVTNDQDWSIFRSYTSLALAEAGTENTSINDTVENFDT